MTLDAFLTWERAQELRYEFDGFGAVAMNGIASRAARALEACFVGRPDYVVFAEAVKIVVDGRVRYPDVVVTCTPFAVTADIVVGEGIVMLPALGVELTLGEIYRELVLSGDDD